MNAASSASAMTKYPIVVPDVQPFVSALTIA
jgi:hypothetical protein